MTPVLYRLIADLILILFISISGGVIVAAWTYDKLRKEQNEEEINVIKRPTKQKKKEVDKTSDEYYPLF